MYNLVDVHTTALKHNLTLPVRILQVEKDWSRTEPDLVAEMIKILMTMTIIMELRMVIQSYLPLPNHPTLVGTSDEKGSTARNLCQRSFDQKATRPYTECSFIMEK